MTTPLAGTKQGARAAHAATAAPAARGDLIARWRHDLTDWPTPAVLIDSAHSVVACNELAAAVGVTAEMTLEQALLALAGDHRRHLAHSRSPRAGLGVRIHRVEAEDFNGWFIDAPDATAQHSGDVQARISQRLADSNLRLQEEIRRRRFLERQVLSVAENEKRRISLDLHDGLGQHLTGLAFLARGLSDELKAQQHRLTGDAEWIVRLLNDAISKTRALARGLWPVSLERDSMADSIRRLAEDLESIFNVSCAVQVIDEPNIMSNVAAHHVFRVLQEAANNAIKHGAARRLTFRLEALGPDFVISLTNDGVAVDPGSLTSGKGLGLVGMRLRADALGATLGIEPVPSGGSEVSLTLPGVGTLPAPGRS